MMRFIAVATLLTACASEQFIEETALTVTVDGPTHVRITPVMEANRGTASFVTLVRVTSTPEGAVDNSTGFLWLAPAEPATDEDAARLDAVWSDSAAAPIDGIVESAMTTRPWTTQEGETYGGWCTNGEDCEVPFTLRIEPREQVFTTDLLIQWHLIMSDAVMQCGPCGTELRAEVLDD